MTVVVVFAALLVVPVALAVLDTYLYDVPCIGLATAYVPGARIGCGVAAKERHAHVRPLLSAAPDLFRRLAVFRRIDDPDRHPEGEWLEA